MAQAALPFLLAATTTLLGVLLAVCKIVVSHIKTTNYTNFTNLASALIIIPYFTN